MSRLRSWRLATEESFELRESNLTLWHSIAFAVNICAPMLLGWWLFDPRLGPLGGILGMLLSLSDTAGRLRQRLVMLGRSTLAVFIFGFAGTHIARDSVPFWSLLIVLTFIAGWYSLSGNNWVSTWRNGALALITTTTTATLGWSTLMLLVFATLVTAFTRAAGHFTFRDHLPVMPVPARRERPEFLQALRFCTIYAAAVALSLALGYWLGANRPLWIAVTVLLVVQPDPRQSFQRVLQRLIGTCVGVAGAAIIVHFVHSETLLALSAGAIAFTLPHGSTRNYWLHSAFTAGLVLVLMDFAISGHDFDLSLLTERIRDVFIGCVIGLTATLLSFPGRFLHQEHETENNAQIKNHATA